jgi:hypothetical protein
MELVCGRIRRNGAREWGEREIFGGGAVHGVLSWGGRKFRECFVPAVRAVTCALGKNTFLEILPNPARSEFDEIEIEC